MSTKVIVSATETQNEGFKTNFIRARKLATHSGMTMNALRLILNAPKLNPNAKILLDKKVFKGE